MSPISHAREWAKETGKEGGDIGKRIRKDIRGKEWIWKERNR